MKKRRVNKEAAIDAIIKELEKGITYTDALEVLKSKWIISRSSFDNYWKEARHRMEVRRKKIEKELMKHRLEHEKKSLNEDIMTIQKRKKWLTRIINAKTTVVKKGRSYLEIIKYEDGREEIITVQDKYRAIQELNRMDGAYAPNRVHVAEDKTGFTIDYEKLSDSTLKELLGQIKGDV